MKVLIIGYGISGKSAEKFLLSKNAKVVIYDDFLNLMPPFEPVDLVVISPGVSPEHPYYKKAQDLGIEIIGEAELAFRYLNQRAVAITGTNGKTTVTLLVEHVLNEAGVKAKALGNVGTPLASYVPDFDEVLVVELSSYQLETMTTPFFEAGVILNITPDHLDRYPSMKEYAEAKFRLKNCIKAEGDFYTFEKTENSSSYEAPFLWDDCKPAFECFNAMAAWHLCKRFNVTEAQFIDALSSFKKPAHRVEFVKEINGVLFYDDSKGTNIDAVIKAVNVMKGPVVLIAGGVDKGASYTLWKEPFCGKVKKIIAIGQAADKICRDLEKDFEIEKEASLEAAVKLAKFIAKAGDCVLLSPGCSSFDMFRDYAHRGDTFKQLVREENLS